MKLMKHLTIKLILLFVLFACSQDKTAVLPQEPSLKERLCKEWKLIRYGYPLFEYTEEDTFKLVIRVDNTYYFDYLHKNGRIEGNYEINEKNNTITFWNNPQPDLKYGTSFTNNPIPIIELSDSTLRLTINHPAIVRDYTFKAKVNK